MRLTFWPSLIKIDIYLIYGRFFWLLPQEKLLNFSCEVLLDLIRIFVGEKTVVIRIIWHAPMKTNFWNLLSRNHQKSCNTSLRNDLIKSISHIYIWTNFFYVFRHFYYHNLILNEFQISLMSWPIQTYRSFNKKNT